MNGSDLTADDGYQSLLGKISDVYTTGQTRATQAVNAHLTETYWQIGHDIVEFEQGGKTRADYGTGLLASLSRDLTLRHGRGFSRSNVIYMRLLYLQYPKGQKPSDLLSWSHHVELAMPDSYDNFLMQMKVCTASLHELQRQAAQSAKLLSIQELETQRRRGRRVLQRCFPLRSPRLRVLDSYCLV